MVAIVASAATASGQATVLRFKTDAFAESAFGSCDFLYPPGPLTCHETDVQVVKEGVGGVPGGTVAPPKTPWAIFIDDYTLSFTSGGPDAVPVLSDERTGFLLDPTVTFDQQHLSYLTVDAQVLMSDGSTFHFAGDWTAVSGRTLFGNNGPALGQFGEVRHHVDRCDTTNFQAHQKYVFATMAGTLNGSSVGSYPDLVGLDFIAYNHFIDIAVTHGDC
jgi:hypothetical protein